MTNTNTYWQSVADSLGCRGFRFRIKWSGDDTMTGWQPWALCPVPGYLETGDLGPVPLREVEWLDVSRLDRNGHDQSSVLMTVLTEVGATFSVTVDAIRVAPQDEI